MSKQPYVISDEQWLAWKKTTGRSADVAKSEHSILTKNRVSAASAAIKSVDDLFAFMKDAPEKELELAVDKLESQLKAEGAGAVVPFVISDETVDRDDDVVDMGGWDLSEYQKNPVMLFGHNHNMPAIGNGLGTYVSNGLLKSVGYFAGKDVNPFGHMIGRMVEEKIIRACSVGFIPKLWIFEADRGPYAVRFTKQELIEWSPCNVGSNRNAMAEGRSIGIDMDPMLSEAVKSLDGDGMLVLPRSELESIYKSLAPGKSFSLPAFRAMATKTESEPEPKTDEEPTLAPDLIPSENPETIAPPTEAPASDPATTEQPQEEPGVSQRSFTDWRAVAVEMSKGKERDDFDRVVRGNTFEPTELSAISKNKARIDKSLCLWICVEIDDEEEESDEPMEPAEAPMDMPMEMVQEGGPVVAGLSASPNVDEKQSVGHDATAIRAIAEQSLRGGLGKMKAEILGN